MPGKLYSIRLSEAEQKQINALKKEGIGITYIFRIGLIQYLNSLNIAPKIIKTKEQIQEVIKEKSPESQDKYNTYGCGCEKEPGGAICPKHSRV